MNKILRDKLSKVFSSIISRSMKQQDVELSPDVEAYVIEMVTGLSTATHTMAAKPVFINDLLRKGLDSDGLVRREYLRLTGDVALLVSGLFPDSLKSRKIVFTLGDFIDIGRTAYSNIDADGFDELSMKFPEVVEVLNTVSVEFNLTSANLLRYAERRRVIDVRISRR